MATEIKLIPVKDINQSGSNVGTNTTVNFVELRKKVNGKDKTFHYNNRLHCIFMDINANYFTEDKPMNFWTDGKKKLGYGFGDEGYVLASNRFLTKAEYKKVFGIDVGGNPDDIVLQPCNGGLYRAIPIHVLTCSPKDDTAIANELISKGFDVTGNIYRAKDEKLSEIKKFFRQRDRARANVAEYDDSIFAINAGCWDLYKYVGSDSTQRGDCYDVSGLGVYASNPLDAVTDTGIVAIDFGTSSTVAAIYNRANDTTSLINLGNGMDYENPTMLKFEDVTAFCKAYEAAKSRPDTDYSKLPAAYDVKQDFTKTTQDEGQGNDILRYMTQLKKWINDPKRNMKSCDKNGSIDLKTSDQTDAEGIDPIEIYAYYLGMHINNMHTGSVYLKYVLSHTATYPPKSRDAIRLSFENGLRKSLPEEVVRDEEAMSKFEVRDSLDEASSYAICALSQYSEYVKKCADSCEEAFVDSFGRTTIHYGVYDFGGGTLDFSFGEFKWDSDDEMNTFSTFANGGASNLGCENILEELAFKLFNDNRGFMNAKGFKCAIPSRLALPQDRSFIAKSGEAIQNSIILAEYLRHFWMRDGAGSESVSSDDFYFDEDLSADTPSLQLRKGKDFENIAVITSDSHGADEERFVIAPATVEGVFRAKIREGVSLFFKTYEELKEQGNSCLIFLAGNASRSKRVKEVFEEEIGKRDNTTNFVCVDPLPTPLGRKKLDENISSLVPTAKTGVAYGLLMYEKGDIQVESVSTSSFIYNVGYRKATAMNSGGNEYAFVLPAHAVSNEFKEIRKIPKGNANVTILFSNDQRYSVKGTYDASSSSVSSIFIALPDEYKGKTLYGRMREDYCDKLDIGVAADGGIDVIGYCDFGENKFVETDVTTVSQANFMFDVGAEDANGNIRWIDAANLSEDQVYLCSNHASKDFTLLYRAVNDDTVESVYLFKLKTLNDTVRVSRAACSSSMVCIHVNGKKFSYDLDRRTK